MPARGPRRPWRGGAGAADPVHLPQRGRRAPLHLPEREATEARRRRRRARQRLRVLEPQAASLSEPGIGGVRGHGVPAGGRGGQTSSWGWSATASAAGRPITGQHGGARAASPSRVPDREGGSPLPGPPPLVSRLCVAQGRAEDQREASANENPKERRGRGERRPTATPPRDLSRPGPTLRACAGTPVALECERPWKRAEFQNLGTTEAVSRRRMGVGNGG